MVEFYKFNRSVLSRNLIRRFEDQCLILLSSASIDLSDRGASKLSERNFANQFWHWRSAYRASPYTSNYFFLVSTAFLHFQYQSTAFLHFQYQKYKLCRKCCFQISVFDRASKKQYCTESHRYSYKQAVLYQLSNYIIRMRFKCEDSCEKR